MPVKPTAARREELLGHLADFVARGGPGPLLAAPVSPGPEAFPEPWRRTRGGVIAVLRRLAWHAGYAGHTITVTDERLGAAPPTERKPETRIALTEVRPKELAFTLAFIGEDDVAGTLAHEVGVAHAALHRPSGHDPYREPESPIVEIDPDRDLERGSIATVYLGLGVLAANAAYQQYSVSGRWNGAYNPLEYDVLRAGYVPMSELAFLLAVQAIVSSDSAGDIAAPRGLEPPQRDEVSAWIAELVGQRDALCARLGVPREVVGLAATPRAIVPFTDIDLADDPEELVRRDAFRWQSHRGGMGLLAGLLLGGAFAMFVASRGQMPVVALGAGGAGHLIGRSIRVRRCTACANVVAANDATCGTCGAALHGDIERLSDRLEAEERLERRELASGAGARAASEPPAA